MNEIQTFQSDAQLTLDALVEFYQRSLAGKDPVIHQPPLADLIDDLDLTSLAADGGLTGPTLARFLDTYLANLTLFYHPANVAHQQAVPHYAAALAGLVDHFVSSDGSIYELGPASVSIEFWLINWLLGKVGWTPAPVPGTEPPPGGGVLANGGSLANLTALIAARTRIAPQVWTEGNPGNLVLLAPESAHYSIARAAGIMGLGHRAVRTLETNEWGLILPDRLPAALDRVEADGERVIALIATAATTATGLYDPLHEIGSFCREHDLWFHVDGAHGGPALLTKKYAHLMRGVELADSLVMNMHKLMRITAFCSALLVRDARSLDQAFTQEASYLFHEKEQPGVDFLQRTIECTKPVLGLKFFMVLAAMGEDGLASHIEDRFEFTTEVYDYFQGLPDFDCPVEPQSNILCFRVKGVGDGHLVLRAKLLARGNTYVSTTDINGKRYLRLTLNNPATTMAEIEGLVEEIRSILAAG